MITKRRSFCEKKVKFPLRFQTPASDTQPCRKHNVLLELSQVLPPSFQIRVYDTGCDSRQRFIRTFCVLTLVLQSIANFHVKLQT